MRPPLLLLLLARLGGAANKVVILAVDGLGLSSLADSPDLPGFQRLRREGTTAQYLLPEFPTTPLTNAYSLVTGLQPFESRIAGDYMYDAESHRTFHSLKGGGDTDSVWWGSVNPLWVSAAQHDLSSFLWWPSCQVPYAGGNFSTLVRCEAARREPEAIIPDLLHHLSRHDLRLAILKLPGFGKDAAAWGPGSGTADTALSAISTFIYKLQDAIRATEVEVNLLVVGLGGFASLANHHAYFLDDFLDVGLIRRVVLNGAFLQIFPKETKEHQVYSALHGVLPNSRVMWKVESPSRLGLKGNPRIAPILVLPDVGYAVFMRKQEKQVPQLTLDSPEFPFPRGLGGYDNAAEEMKGVFFASGPDFSAGAEVGWMRASDVYLVASDLLGIRSRSIPPRLEGLVSSSLRPLPLLPSLLLPLLLPFLLLR